MKVLIQTGSSKWVPLPPKKRFLINNIRICRGMVPKNLMKKGLEKTMVKGLLGATLLTNSVGCTTVNNMKESRREYLDSYTCWETMEKRQVHMNKEETKGYDGNMDMFLYAIGSCLF